MSAIIMRSASLNLLKSVAKARNSRSSNADVDNYGMGEINGVARRLPLSCALFDSRAFEIRNVQRQDEIGLRNDLVGLPGKIEGFCTGKLNRPN